MVYLSKTLAEQESKAVFAIKSKLSLFGALPSNILFKNIQRAYPYLHTAQKYGSKDKEKVHNDVCKYVLKVTNFTSNVFILLEVNLVDKQCVMGAV